MRERRNGKKGGEREKESGREGKGGMEERERGVRGREQAGWRKGKGEGE